MICKKCGLDISGDCVLTGRPDVEGICVFCFYGIDSWDSNGQLVTKDQATRGIGWWTKEDLEIWRMESKYWNKILNLLHLLMIEKYRENKFWQEMVKLREEYIKELEDEK